MNIILFFMNELKKPIVTNLNVSDNIEKVLFLIEKYFNLSSERILILSEYGINLTEQNSKPLSQFISEGENSLTIFIFRIPINVDKDFIYQVVKNPNSFSSTSDDKNQSKMIEKSLKTVICELERINIYINRNLIFFQELLEISDLYNKGIIAVKNLMKITVLLQERNVKNLCKLYNGCEKLITKIDDIHETTQGVIEFFNVFNLPNGEILNSWFNRNVLNDEISNIFKQYENLKQTLNSERRQVEHLCSQQILDENKNLLNLKEHDYKIEINSMIHNLNSINAQTSSVINVIEGNQTANKRRLSLLSYSDTHGQKLKTIEKSIIVDELKFQNFFTNFNQYINSMNSMIDDTFKRSRNSLFNQQLATKYCDLLTKFVRKGQLVLDIVSTPSIIRYLNIEIVSREKFKQNLINYKKETYEIWDQAIAKEKARREYVEKIISRHFISKLYSQDTGLELKNLNINEEITLNSIKNSNIETVSDKLDPLYIDNNQGLLNCRVNTTEMFKTEMLDEGVVINLSNKAEYVNGIPRAHSFCVQKNRSNKYHNTIVPQKSIRKNSEGDSYEGNLDRKRLCEKYFNLLVTEFSNVQLDYQNDINNLIISVHEINEEKQALENQIEELKQQVQAMKDKESEENKNLLHHNVIKKGDIVSFIYDHRISNYFVAMNPNSKSCPYFLSTDDPIYNKDKNEREPFFQATVKSIRSATIKLDENRFKLSKGTDFYLITIERK